MASSLFVPMIDRQRMAATVADAKAGLDAIDSITKGTGVGEVITSKRIKLRGEKKRALHGQAIANILRKGGHDPFKYPQVEISQATDVMAEELEEAVQDAWRTNRPQRDRLKRVLIAIALELSTWAASNIKRGGLGKRAPSKRFTMKRWQSMVKRGTATDRYGLPPPRGIMTGRFVEGIRSRWRLGGRGS